MKNILLLGNGFDLNFSLPTKYVNFLNVVNYLVKNEEVEYWTVGEVFANAELQKMDPFIGYCYTKHCEAFNHTELDEKDLEKLKEISKNNIWISYLNHELNKDTGWIDFEKEISYVLTCFKKLFDKSTVVNFNQNETDVEFIGNFFDFYFNNQSMGAYRVSDEFCIERPVGSGNRIVNRGKVVKKLYDELLSLKLALKLYLKNFIENVLQLIKENGEYNQISLFSYMRKVISFNYTNTYEEIYYNNEVFHIHGNLKNEIVLGVNPDESDYFENTDTTFIRFKKYFQRTEFDTDYDYLRWINDINKTDKKYRLFVLGHSLDVTDRDILVELFEYAEEVYIFFHDIDAKRSYIENLILLFGKEKFDVLKKDKKLTFLLLNDDFSNLEKEIEKESWDDIQIGWELIK